MPSRLRPPPAIELRDAPRGAAADELAAIDATPEERRRVAVIYARHESNLETLRRTGGDLRAAYVAEQVELARLLGPLRAALLREDSALRAQESPGAQEAVRAARARSEASP